MSQRTSALFVLLAAATPFCVAAESSSSLAHLRAGETFLQQRDLQLAAIEFATAAKGDLKPAWTLVWSHIDLGRILDATGQHERAVKEYQLAIDTNDNTFGAIGFANLYLSKAPTIDDMFPLPSNFDDVSAPKVLTRVEPKYSAEALLAGLEGSVQINAVVDREGGTMDLKVLRSLGLGLDETALEAVGHWTFAPGSANGEPVIDGVPVEVRFVLPSSMPGWHVTRITFAKPDTAGRPVLVRAGGFIPGKMSPELAEEGNIDAAIGRKPTATVSIEIDTLGNPAKMQVEAASLPEWGEDAIRTLSDWRFSPAMQSGEAVGVKCLIDLAWFPPQ